MSAHGQPGLPEPRELLIMDLQMEIGTFLRQELPEVGCQINQPSWRFGGDLAEVVAFQSSFSNSDRETIECYLAYKYGLTISHSCP